MTQPSTAPGTAASACPFVAFRDDRDRRSETPDRRNHCYAEPVPQPRALAHQAQYCLAPEFPACPVFLAWAARAAAAPATSAGRDEPWPDADTSPPAEPADEGLPPGGPGSGSPAAAGLAAEADEAAGMGVAATGIRLPRPRSTPTSEAADWLPTTAWEDVAWTAPEPGPEEAPASPEPQASDAIDVEDVPGWGARPPESSATIPAARLAALPVRRRGSVGRPLRAIGSGEWESGPPPSREPVVRRGLLGGYGGVLAVALAVVLALGAILALASLMGGGGGPAPTATPAGSAGGAGALPGASGASGSPRPLPSLTSAPSPSATPKPSPTPQLYRVRRGDTLSGISARFRVSIDLLQCSNGIRDADVLSVGQQLVIPPRNAACPSDASPSASS